MAQGWHWAHPREAGTALGGGQAAKPEPWNSVEVGDVRGGIVKPRAGGKR